jgi:hypothetical protein
MSPMPRSQDGDEAARSPRTAAIAPLRDAAAVAVLVLAAIYWGSGRLTHLDHALLGYLGATVVATFGVAYRMSAFWRRVPTAFYARALAAALRRPRSLATLGRHAGSDLAAQRFIARRGQVRRAAHVALSLGTLASFAITVPLVCGWLRFEARGQSVYIMRFAGVPAGSFDVEGPIAFLVFHGLTIAAIAVVAGAVTFLFLRWRADAGSQTGSFHVAPLAVLLVVALTGLALPATRGVPRLFDAAALAHEIAVVAMMVALPFTKLGHVLIRPLQLGVRMVRADGAAGAACVRCGGALAPAAQLAAVEAALAARGFRFDGHQRACPRCRRALVAATPATLLGAAFHPRIAGARPAPMKVERAA